MPLTKSKGNMYPWVTHMHTHLAGKCGHECRYCYVQQMSKRFGTERYTGKPRLVHKELGVNYGKGKTIFIEHCNDLFEESVKDEWIVDILKHCCEYPDNEYVFQTKNPIRVIGFLGMMPKIRLIGCTIETNRAGISGIVSKAPTPFSRFKAMAYLSNRIGERIFITIEPILKADMRTLADWCQLLNTEFVNIGADSKGTCLNEPSSRDVVKLIKYLNEYGVEIKQKRNLERLMK